MERLPWFKFLAFDWLSSPLVRTMTDAQKGQFIDAMAMIWCSKSCGIDRVLASQLFPDLISFEENGNPVLIPHPEKPELITHPKLIEQVAAHAYQVEKGREGAVARWGFRRDPNGDPITDPNASKRERESKRKSKRKTEDKDKGRSAPPDVLKKAADKFISEYPVRDTFACSDTTIRKKFYALVDDGEHTADAILWILEEWKKSDEWQRGFVTGPDKFLAKTNQKFRKPPPADKRGGSLSHMDYTKGPDDV